MLREIIINPDFLKKKKYCDFAAIWNTNEVSSLHSLALYLSLHHQLKYACLKHL